MTALRCCVLVVLVGLLAACALRARDENVVRGEHLFVRYGCNGCHMVGASGTPIGPPLDGVGRSHDQEWFRVWLHDPTSQRPRAHMPPIALPDEDARILATFLASLR